LWRTVFVDSNSHQLKGNQKMSEPLALNVIDAATKARVGQTKIRAEIKSGRLQARRAGKLFLITPDDLSAWLHSLPRVAA
jgi:excisionase family DNA binding protein